MARWGHPIMNVSALEEYGLRCAVRLASLKPDQTLSAPEIAELEGLSVEYVSKFMIYLKKANLVRTVRGMKGGFALTKPAHEISLSEVFDALSGKRSMSTQPNEEDFSSGFCGSYTGKKGSCVRAAHCTIRPFWRVLSHYIHELTRELYLSDFLTTEHDAFKKAEMIAKRNFEQLQKQKLGSLIP